MKVWKFFKKPDSNENISGNVPLSIKYPVYALTNNKKYAKRFKKERNMNAFIVTTSDDVEPEEYAEYANNNRDAVLEISTIITREILNGIESHTEFKEVDVLITSWEKSFIVEQQVYLLDDDGYWYDTPSPYLFKSKYKCALKDFEYHTFHNLYNSDMIISKWAEEEGDDDFASPALILDELSYLIFNFGETFKI